VLIVWSAIRRQWSESGVAQELGVSNSGSPITGIAAAQIRDENGAEALNRVAARLIARFPVSQ